MPGSRESTFKQSSAAGSRLGRARSRTPSTSSRPVTGSGGRPSTGSRFLQPSASHNGPRRNHSVIGDSLSSSRDLRRNHSVSGESSKTSRDLRRNHSVSGESSKTSRDLRRNHSVSGESSKTSRDPRLSPEKHNNDLEPELNLKALKRAHTSWDFHTDQLRPVRECSRGISSTSLDNPLDKLHTSDIFQRVMLVMQQSQKIKEAARERANEVAPHSPAVHVTFQEADKSSIEHSEEEEEEEESTPENTSKKAAGKRAWRLIKRNMQEVTMEKRQNATSMNWTFLKHAISQVTDMEKGRKVLYERYIYKPDQWAEGFTKFPTHLIRPTKNGRMRLYTKEALCQMNEARGTHRNSTRTDKDEQAEASND